MRAIISHVSDVCVELGNEKVAVLIRLYIHYICNEIQIQCEMKIK